MNIFFRVDASIEIGSGHVMRCLALAEALRNHEISFIIREREDDLYNLISEKFRVYRLPPITNNSLSPHPYGDWLGVSLEEDSQDTLHILKQQKNKPDWFIVDHYALDISWEIKIKPYVRNIMVIDDLANREHLCELLLDQGMDTPLRYKGLVPSYCKLLLGPHFALLRSEFHRAKTRVPKRNGCIKRIHVCFGGSDKNHVTEKTIQAIKLLGRFDLAIDVIMGLLNPNACAIQNLCRSMKNTTLYHPAKNIADLMSQADLAIGGGGSSHWERCYMILPTIALILSENQRLLTEHLARERTILNLGWFENVTPVMIKDALLFLLSSPSEVRKMSEKSGAVVDGRGTERVTQELF